MIPLILATVLAAAPVPPEYSAAPLAEAERAIAAGRLDQARIMIGNAVQSGAQGEQVDRLLAHLESESGNCKAALVRYQAIFADRPPDALLAERAGICAARTSEWARAAKLLDVATASPTASWRAWNARGVAADNLGDWTTADAAYARALALAPDRAEVANNLGWSLLLRSRWSEALEQFVRAANLDRKSERIANNLELAKAAVSEDLPRRRPDESDRDWAARLNDAGLVAHIRGEHKKAVAAFAQAIEARSQWFERAANNLSLVESAR